MLSHGGKANSIRGKILEQIYLGKRPFRGSSRSLPLVDEPRLEEISWSQYSSRKRCMKVVDIPQLALQASK